MMSWMTLILRSVMSTRGLFMTASIFSGSVAMYGEM